MKRTRTWLMEHEPRLRAGLVTNFVVYRQRNVKMFQ